MCYHFHDVRSMKSVIMDKERCSCIQKFAKGVQIWGLERGGGRAEAQ